MNSCADAASVQRLKGIAPNRWVASRHFVSQNQHRVCIWNELTHSFTVFEDEDARLWAYIAQHAPVGVKALADALCRPANEIDTWVTTHMRTYLLCDSDAPPPASIASVTRPQEVNADQAGQASWSAPDLSSQATEAEFQAWALNRGYRWSASWDLSNVLKQGNGTLTDLKNQGVFQLRLEDRQHALRPAFFAALHEARRLGFSITIASHGLRLNSVDLELIIAAYPHCVEISLPAADASEQDTTPLAPDTLETAQNTIRYLSKAGVKVRSTLKTES